MYSSCVSLQPMTGFTLTKSHAILPPQSRRSKTMTANDNIRPSRYNRKRPSVTY